MTQDSSWLLKYKSQLSGKTILEIGCGEGCDTQVMAKIAGSITAIDKDINYGSVGYPEIESGLFSVEGQQKRFFTKASVLDYFAKNWQIDHLEEKTIDRYHKPKVIWEFVARNIWWLLVTDNWSVLQAISIALNTALFGSLFEEIPVHMLLNNQKKEFNGELP